MKKALTEKGIRVALDVFENEPAAKARGYRTTRNLKAITYLIAGKLDLRLPT